MEGDGGDWGIREWSLLGVASSQCVWESVCVDVWMSDEIERQRIVLVRAV